jgi:DNA-binding LytR/AlgR family response regulator
MTRIVELRHPPQGALCVVLRDGTELSVSRRRREAVVQYIGRSR